REVADLGQARGTQVGDLMLFQIGPNGFDRVELGRVGRQERNGEAAILLFQPLPQGLALVRSHAVPNDQQRARDLPDQGTEKLDDLLGTDRAIEEAEVKAPPAQSSDGRHLLPREALLDHGGVSFQRPGAGDRTLLRQARLVYEDDGSALPLGVFFRAGQDFFFQRWIACSLRCRARRSGRCGVKPRPRNNSQPPEWLYATPNSRLTRARTRLMVHSSVANPAASAPSSNLRRSASHCLASSDFGRPSGLALSLPSAPLALASFCAHTFTDWRVTPSRRATSASDTLRLSIRAPAMRRASIAFMSRLAMRSSRRDDSRRFNAQGYQTVVTHLLNSQ